MSPLLYILAAIGGVVVLGFTLLMAAWAFIHLVARAELRRKARLAPR
jgi:hypothetical protein